MKRIVIFFFLCFSFVNETICQKDENKIEHGIVISSRLDSDDDFKFNVKGFGLEGGYYFFKKIGNKGSISIEGRVAYAQTERMSTFDIMPFNLFVDSIQTQHRGTINYSNISLAIPVKYRRQITSESPLFLLIGYNPYLNLYDSIKWRYDEIQFDSKNDIIIYEIKDQEESLEQRFYNADVLLGLGLKKSKFMMDLTFSFGSPSFSNHEFLYGFDKLSLIFNFYYRIK